MTRTRRRFPWLVLALGLALGAAGGLYYAWFLDPVSRVNISPAQLNAEDRQTYVLLVSEAYRQDGDLERARARLAARNERDLAGLVKTQADTAFIRADDPQTVCALAELAGDLGAEPFATEMCGAVAADVPPMTPTITATFEGVPTITPTPFALTVTPTPFFPTPTPTAFRLPEAGFELTARYILCEQSRRTGLIQVFVYDDLEQGLPGVAILIEWAGGSERIYTGLKSGIDPGYADFRMEPGLLYSVSVDGLSEPVVGVEAAECQTEDGQDSIQTVQLVFEPDEGEEDGEQP